MKVYLAEISIRIHFSIANNDLNNINFWKTNEFLVKLSIASSRT